MPEALNGYYPELDPSLVPHERRVTDMTDMGIDIPRQSPTHLRTKDLEGEPLLIPESQIQQQCQEAEDYAHAIPHLIELAERGRLSKSEVTALMHDGTNAAQHALASLFQGRMSITPMSLQALLMLTISNIFEINPTVSVLDLIKRVSTTILMMRGPDALPELVREAKMLQGTADEPPKFDLPFPDRRPKKEIIH